MGRENSVILLFIFYEYLFFAWIEGGKSNDNEKNENKKKKKRIFSFLALMRRIQ